MKKFLQAGLTALALTGLFALPIHEADAATRCREIVVRGQVVKRICTTTPGYREGYRHRGPYGYRDEPGYRRHRRVCEDYWRHGTRYRNCYKVRAYGGY